jgi:hypothetical protein
MAEEKQLKVKKIITTPSPTSISDTIRTSIRNDRSIMLQFVSDTPDFQIENHRTVLSEELVKKLMDNLCLVTDYYPKKNTGSKSKKTSSTKKK